MENKAFNIQKKVEDNLRESYNTLLRLNNAFSEMEKFYSFSRFLKSVLLYQGENVNRAFLDILNQLERIDIVNVDEWFEIRDLRNETVHDHDDNDLVAMNILNMIFKLKDDLEDILKSITVLIDKRY